MNKESVIKFAKTIFEVESQAVKEQINSLNNDFFNSVLLINSVSSKSGRVVVTGMGKSGLIGRKIAATFSSLGIPSIFVHPAEIVHGDMGMMTKIDLVIALSYSGESEEVKKILPYIKTMGLKIISITGRVNSFITKFADYVLYTPVKKEACPYNLVPTASTTAMLAMGDALALSAAKMRGFKKEDFAKFHPGGNLGSKLTLKVEKLMHTGKENPVIAENLKVKDALKVMTQTKLGAVSIVNAKGKLTGYFTDGDLRRNLQNDRNLLDRRISEVMTKNPKCITANKLAVDAVEIMNRYNCDNLPVIDKAGKPIGIIDERDLIVAGIK
ncbi:MAG: hypothetical protein A2252_00575 [Elusimicrobia bacterium RIFOXYA2_FULL_39_19]|nr:MAG: hypothetical protein A2252_00575 [Elusimicrobia bacterium RIFOXYA2_FULL_39_19]